MASNGTGVTDSSSGTATPYAPRFLVGAWVAAGWAAVAYGLFLTFSALQSLPGEPLTGRFVGQPAFKALMAVLLALAAAVHPVVRERRWLMLALVFSALGDFLLAIPWWAPAFVGGLGAFLIAHVCYLGALAPLAVRTRRRLVAVGAMCLLCLALLVWFWPYLGPEKLTAPVTIYIAVLCAMVCAALLAKLPTPWTALGAVCFALSDAMIGIDQFILQNDLLAVPIWWVYAMSQILITAGLFFGRQIPTSRVADKSDSADTPEE